MRSNIKYVGIFLGFILLFSAGVIAGKTDKKEVLSQKTFSSPSPNAVSSSAPNPNLGSLYQVAKVVDGDTIDVIIDGKSKAIRLIGIDTPEVVDPRKPVQCFGAQASQKAKDTLTGKSVYLEADPTQGDTDKYKRLLRYVFLSDGTNFNLSMISQGFAHEYTYDLPYKYQSQFKSAEKEARGKEIGLWSPDTCSGNTTTSILYNSSNGTSYQELHQTIKTDNSTTQIIQQTSTSQGQTVSN